jgi:hypothetical protein
MSRPGRTTRVIPSCPLVELMPSHRVRTCTFTPARVARSSIA